MAELKQGRWVKVHEQGQANFTENDNVMDIMIGAGRCQAEATYTVRNFKKAAYWMVEYLKAAEALAIVAESAIQQIQTAAESAGREDDEVTASGEGWNCTIERMGDGGFKVQLGWAVDEPVTKKQKTTRKKEDTAEKKEDAPKKRGRKKKAPAENAEAATQEVNANEVDA